MSRPADDTLDCPTCDGHNYLDLHGGTPCPDCQDGRVPREWVPKEEADRLQMFIDDLLRQRDEAYRAQHKYVAVDRLTVEAGLRGLEGWRASIDYGLTNDEADRSVVAAILAAVVKEARDE